MHNKKKIRYNNQIISNIKLAVLGLLFVLSACYAVSAMFGLIYNNEYSQTLSFHSLKLDKSKTYLFVKDFQVTTSPDTIIIPMGRVNMPENLCALYYNEEWKLKLTDNLRKNDEDAAKEKILYPFCRLNKIAGKEFHFSKKIFKNKYKFFDSKKTPRQDDLKEGVKFSYNVSGNAFIVQIDEKNGKWYLTKGAVFLPTSKRSVPISNKNTNIVEINFCTNGSTSGENKYAFAFPFLQNGQPAIDSIVVKNGKLINKENIDKNGFIYRNDCVFQLKNNYNDLIKYIIFPLLFCVIAGFSLHFFLQMRYLNNKTQNLEQRNLIKTEQFNILSLRLIFNCIILLGFPILLLKTQYDENAKRLVWIVLLAVILNINWKVFIGWYVNASFKSRSFWVVCFVLSVLVGIFTKSVLVLLLVFSIIIMLKWFVWLIKNNSQYIPYIVSISILLITIATFFSSNELVFAKIPVLKFTTMIFILLPFLISKNLFKPIIEKISNTPQIQEWFNNEKHHHGENHSDYISNTLLNIIRYFLLIVIVFIIWQFSDDSAAFMFTFFGIVLIFFTSFGKFWRFAKPSNVNFEKGSFIKIISNLKNKDNFAFLLLLLFCITSVIVGYIVIICPEKYRISCYQFAFIYVVIIIILSLTVFYGNKELIGLRIATIFLTAFSFVGGVLLSEELDEKKYRFRSFLDFPDNEELYSKYPDIESSRETVAGQIFLLNSVDFFNADFKTVVLPEFKTVFFSDYAILWSFKTGGWLWFWIYLGVLLMLAYIIISLMIILSKSIRLKNQKKAYYSSEISAGLNLLLAVLLVQYIYTFLANFWCLPLTGQSSGLLSPTIWEYVFHIIIINYLYFYLVSSFDNRKEKTKFNDVRRNIPDYITTKGNLLLFLSLFLFGGIVWFKIQHDKINDYIPKQKYIEKRFERRTFDDETFEIYTIVDTIKTIVAKENEMSWDIVKDSALTFYKSLSKDSLLILAHEIFPKVMTENKDALKKYRYYIWAHYESDNANKYSKHIDYFKVNTNIDSITKTKEILSKDNKDTIGYLKFVNGNSAKFVNNKYYGGCPPDAQTIDFELQVKLNRLLEEWAVKIDEKGTYKMIGGSIIVAENKTGEIRASASYPLMRNENRYSVLYKEKELNDSLKEYHKELNDNLRERHFDTIFEKIKDMPNNNNYTNLSEYKMMPGSIVKPLLAYSALLFMNDKYSRNTKDFNDVLSKSLPKPTEAMFQDLFVENNFFGKADTMFRNDFGFGVYYHRFDSIKEAIVQNVQKNNIYSSHAIGLQHKLVFKNIVQAYMRIKTGKKVVLKYENNENENFDTLKTLNNTQFEILRNAMKDCLKTGTAKDVGSELKISNLGYLAKTGTAEIMGDKTKNRTSAFIIVTDSLTIGIQLYGVVPGNQTDLHAKDLYKKKIHNIVFSEN